MIILEEIFKWHLEAFASELFIYIYIYIHTHRDVYVLTPFHYVPQLNSTTTHIAHIKDNVAIMHRF